MIRHGLPPIDQFLRSAITGRYMCTHNGSPSSIFSLDHLVLFHSRRQALKPACDGAVLPRHHASQKSCVAFARRLDRCTAAREAASCGDDLTAVHSTAGRSNAKRRNENHTETGLQQSDRQTTGSCHSVQRTATRSINQCTPVP